VVQAVVVNGENGLVVDGPSNRLYDVAACDNAVHGIEDLNPDHDTLGVATWWQGKLIAGNNGASDCWQAGTPTGTPTCPAFHEVLTGCTLAGHFVGKVTAPDAVNRSSSNPAGPISGVADWTRFVDPFRGWGVDSLDDFPAPSNRGPCSFGHDCRMWDWSLVAGPPLLRDTATGWPLTAHTWVSATPPQSQADCDTLARGSFFVPQGPPDGNICHSVVFQGAIEVAGDGIGNDNGLCENGDTCMRALNFGSYQGHGALIPFQVIVPYPGVRMVIVEHELNGYDVGHLP
jgi:hypothetical protein